MNLQILGARILVRAYELPEQTAGGILLPDFYRKGYDGKFFEVIEASEKVKETLGIIAEGTTSHGETLYVGLRADSDCEPLHLEADDIIELRGQMQGTPAGPELERVHGPCWFLNATHFDALRQRDVPTIKHVLPSRQWKEEEKAA